MAGEARRLVGRHHERGRQPGVAAGVSVGAKLGFLLWLASPSSPWARSFAVGGAAAILIARQNGGAGEA